MVRRGHLAQRGRQAKGDIMGSGFWQRLSSAWQDHAADGAWGLGQAGGAVAQPKVPLATPTPAPSPLLGNEQAMIQVQVLAYDFTQTLTQQMASMGPLHWPTLLGAAGALAGYSCQAGVAMMARQHGVAPEQALHIQQLADGRYYSRCTLVDRLVLEDHPSLWSVLAAAAFRRGVQAQHKPNMGQLYSYVDSTLGTSSFGVLRIEPMWLPQPPPQGWPLHFWPEFNLRLQQAQLQPLHWHVVFALVAYQLMEQAAAQVPPAVALQIVMESALPASRLVLDRGGSAP